MKKLDSEDMVSQEGFNQAVTKDLRMVFDQTKFIGSGIMFAMILSLSALCMAFFALHKVSEVMP